MVAGVYMGVVDDYLAVEGQAQAEVVQVGGKGGGVICTHTHTIDKATKPSAYTQ